MALKATEIDVLRTVGFQYCSLCIITARVSLLSLFSFLWYRFLECSYVLKSQWQYFTPRAKFEGYGVGLESGRHRWEAFIVGNRSQHRRCRPISSSKKQKKLVSSDRHISYSTYRESFKASFKGIVPDISKYSNHSTRSGGATIAANSALKKGFSNVMEDGKRRRLRICMLRIQCL